MNFALTPLDRLSLSFKTHWTSTTKSLSMAMTSRIVSLLFLTSLVWIVGCANYVPGDAAYNLGHSEVAREMYESRSRVSGSKLLHANNLKSGSDAAIESKTVMSFINNSLIVTFSNGVTLTT